MRLAVIGTGYVGLVSGACFADWGWDVTCVDQSDDKIKMLKAGKIPIHEPGLDEVVARAVGKGTLHFTTDLAAAVKDAEVVFLAVGTPTLPGGDRADLSQIFGAARQVIDASKGYKLIVTKSTVPVGTAAQLRELAASMGRSADIDIASNPEFLREGAAVEDFFKPDRVVVGVDTTRAASVLKALYAPVEKMKLPVLVTDTASAELIKYAANGFLATKIAFINEMADIAEKVGADVMTVARGMGLDKRIGEAFLNAGPGFGGSCFPKDTRALGAIAREAGTVSRVTEAVIQSNHVRRDAMFAKIDEAIGGLHGKQIAVLGLAFKANTDDMRESIALSIVPALVGVGAKVVAYDPAAMAAAKPMLPAGVTYASSEYKALDGADAVVVLTEWPEFKAIDWVKAHRSMKANPVVVDLRNLYSPSEMAAWSFRYVSVGRAEATPVSAVKRLHG